MKTKAQKNMSDRPPGSLELALDKLEATYGPLAIDTAIRNRLTKPGRRPERSIKTKLAVWSLVEERSRQTNTSISTACRYAAAHWVICDMNEFVGSLHSSRDTIARCRYGQSTWRRIHAEASKFLSDRPQEKARWEQFICRGSVSGLSPA
jgi:hypothetical protein